jgi:hypothetical protein
MVLTRASPICSFPSHDLSHTISNIYYLLFPLFTLLQLHILDSGFLFSFSTLWQAPSSGPFCLTFFLPFPSSSYKTFTFISSLSSTNILLERLYLMTQCKIETLQPSIILCPPYTAFIFFKTIITI